MKPILLCILPSKQFEETFENAQRRKVKQMQPMLLYDDSDDERGSFKN